MRETLFISPHNDDETLFGACAIMRAHADVLVVYDSYVQVERGHLECTWYARRQETIAAVKELHGGDLMFAGLRDTDGRHSADDVAAVAGVLRPYTGAYANIFLPAFEENGHDQHNLVALAGRFLEAGRPDLLIKYYGTYTRIPGDNKTRLGVPQRPNGIETVRKLRALACYRTQIELDDCRPHFQRDLEEYLL